MRSISPLIVMLFVACGGHGVSHDAAVDSDGRVLLDARQPIDAFDAPDAAPADAATPPQSAVLLEAGGGSACIIGDDHSLWCWGRNFGGVLGLGDEMPRALPVRRPGAWESVSVGDTLCAIDTSHALWCFSGTFHRLGSASDWSQVSAGGYICGLRGTPGTASVWCALGAGEEFQAIGADADWVQVSSGIGNMCGIRAGGALYCWSQAGFPTPVSDLGSAGWSDIGVGPQMQCGIHDGDLYCWGGGFLGDGAPTGSFVPTPQLVANPSTTPWAHVFVDAVTQYVCATQTDETLWCWGLNNSAEIDESRRIAVNVPTPQFPGTSWTAAAITWGNAFGLRSDGSVVIWGSDELGVLDGIPSTYLEPETIPGDWTVVDTIDAATCGIKADHTLWCWGAPGAIVEWTGEVDGVARPRSRYPIQLGTDSDWAKVSISSTHQCAIKVGGALYCWGSNERGQAGVGPAFIATPQRVGTDSWSDVGVANQFTCGITGGTLECWGDNEYGQLGRGVAAPGNGDPVPAPIVSTETFVDLISGYMTTCGITDQQEMFCWGFDQVGQVGRGAVTSSYPWSVATPTLVQSNIGASSMGAADGCAGRSAGGLVCWGENYGVVPSTVSTATFPMVGGHSPYSCALRAVAGGTRPMCTGRNDTGALGTGVADPTGTLVLVPQAVLTNRIDWTLVTSSGRHSCGIAGDDDLLCWGSGQFGELGDGNAWTHSPVEVHFD